MSCLDDLTWNYPMKHFFLLATIAMITVKILLPVFIAAVVTKLYLVSIAKDKDPSIRLKMHQTFLFFIFTTICLISAEFAF